MPDEVQTCRRCGHARSAHEHYRRGTDCSLCPCPTFAAPPNLLGRLLGAVRRQP